LGVMLGTSYYNGDLNQFVPFRRTKPAGSILYRYNIHSRAAFRATFSYGQVAADDADSQFAQNQDRNLNFESDIWELAAGFEINYFPFRIGHDRFKGTCYLFGAVGAFRMNPKTNYNGAVYELQPLGTEGQGTSLSGKPRYSKYQPVIPFGFGGRVSLGKSAALGVEFGIRKTFTDYLDDVGSDYYADYDVLLAESGPIAAELSNRSGSRNGRRGTAATKDWYVFTGATLTFRLGKPNKCFGQYRF